MKAKSEKRKIRRLKPKPERGKSWTVFFLLLLGTLGFPVVTIGQELNREGWPIPDLKGLIPYSIQVRQMDGVEKIVEKFLPLMEDISQG